MKSNYEKMLGEEYYVPDGELREVAIACSNGLSYINSTPSRDPEREKFLKNFFGAYGEGNVIKGNFNCDYAKHIFIGNNNVTLILEHFEAKEVIYMDIEKVLEAFRKNRYEASYFATAEEATDYLDSKIDGKLVGVGDSMTLVKLGISERLKKHNDVKDVKDSPAFTGKGFAEFAKCTLLTDVFMCSANAITEDGIVVNMDGTGNRVAAAIYGHEKTYYVVGINKLCPTLEDAIWRVRNVAAPRNAHRKHKKTPCAIKGDKCYNCSSPERICNGLLIEYKKMSNIDMEVVIVGEELGL